MMRIFFKLTSAVCILSVLGACSQSMDEKVSDNGIPVIDRIDLSTAERCANEGINEFAFKLMNEAARNTDASASTQGNFTFSPLSAALALSMIANTADSEAETAVAEILGQSDMDALNSVCNKLMRFLPSRNTGGRVMLANSFWYDLSLTPLQSWRDRMERVLYADTKGLCFANEGSADVINRWTAGKTEGLINKVADTLDPDTKAYLVNAMYVMGKWKAPFKREETTRKGFSGADGDVMVDMMRGEKRSVYFANDSFEMVNLPFDGSLSMFLILPSQGVEANELARNLSYETFRTALHESSPYLVDLSLPKFKVYMEMDLSGSLNALGLPSNCMFEKMGVDEGGPLRIRQITSTSVDEEGVELAAVTTGDVVGAANINKDNFVTLEFNRPFIYMVYDTESASILLTGVVNNL